MGIASAQKAGLATTAVDYPVFKSVEGNHW
jgi:hypothetical protein